MGKTAIAEGLAQRIVDGNVPQSMKDKKVVSLDISALLSGAMMRGQFEERLKGVLKDVKEGVIILKLHTWYTEDESTITKVQGVHGEISHFS